MATSVLRLTVGLTIAGGLQYAAKTFAGTISNNDSTNDSIKTVGTSEGTVTFTDITTNGWVLIENLDATNYVQWGVATTVYSGRVSFGMPALFQLEPGKTLYVKANTAACRCRIIHVGSA